MHITRENEKSLKLFRDANADKIHIILNTEKKRSIFNSNTLIKNSLEDLLIKL
jgi:hypothetical protein